LILVRLPDLEVVQDGDEILYEGLELTARHPHVGMRLRHVASGVGAGSTGRLAHLIDKLFCQSVKVGPGELLIDAGVFRRAIFKGEGGCPDAIGAADALIKRTVHCCHLLCDHLPTSPGWLASIQHPGPSLSTVYTGKEMRCAHFDLQISLEVFDEVSRELANALDDFRVPEREKQEVLAAFAAEKGEVTAGSQPGAVNWRNWR